MRSHKELGVIHGRLASMPATPNAVSSQTTHQNQRVEALPMAGSVAETLDKILACLKQMGDNKIKNKAEDYVHAVFTSRLMRFKDDVELYIDVSAQQVHFRSASRIGYSDLGANRKRYEAFKALYI